MKTLGFTGFGGKDGTLPEKEGRSGEREKWREGEMERGRVEKVMKMDGNILNLISATSSFFVFVFWSTFFRIGRNTGVPYLI